MRTTNTARVIDMYLDEGDQQVIPKTLTLQERKDIASFNMQEAQRIEEERIDAYFRNLPRYEEEYTFVTYGRD